MQAEPAPEHEPPVHTPADEQVSVPQHWLEVVQPPPSLLQVAEELQTPPEQVAVPQHCEEVVHRVPMPWQDPPEQTLLALQSRVPQQSAEELQRWFEVWQEPVAPSSMTGSSSPLDWLQAVAAKTAAARRTERTLRMGGV